jgi:hypothetical protein
VGGGWDGHFWEGVRCYVSPPTRNKNNKKQKKTNNQTRTNNEKKGKMD